MDRAIDTSASAGRRRIVLLAIAATVVLAAALAIPTLRRWSRAEGSLAAASVRTALVTRGNLVRDASAQGKVVAALHPTLFAAAPGIVSLKAKAGEAVKKDQLLASLESPELLSRLSQESATLASSRSALERQRIAVRQTELKNTQNVNLLDLRLAAARRLHERAERTFAEGLINKIDFEKAKDDVAIAELELTNARKSTVLERETGDFDVNQRRLEVGRQESVVAELRRQADRLVVKAPFDGLVASVAVQDRDSVPMNAPLLTVVSLSALEVEFALPESYASDVAPGMSARIVYEGSEYAGRVTAVSPEIKDGQITGTVVFASGKPAGLRQSQRVSVRMVFEEKKDVLKLPRGPFLEGGAGRQAWVVDESGVATRQTIEIGAISVAEVEVVKGLREGDRVILSDMTAMGSAKTVLLRR